MWSSLIFLTHTQHKARDCKVSLTISRIYHLLLLLLLVVSLPLHKSSGVPAQDELPRLVVDEDEEGEGEGGNPPVDLERVHPQPLVHSGGVGQHRRQHRLEEQAKVEHPVLHALLEDRVLAGLADDEVGPLDHHNGDKEGGVAGVLQDLTVLVMERKKCTVKTEMK